MKNRNSLQGNNSKSSTNTRWQKGSIRIIKHQEETRYVNLSELNKTNNIPKSTSEKIMNPMQDAFYRKKELQAFINKRIINQQKKSKKDKSLLKYTSNYFNIPQHQNYKNQKFMRIDLDRTRTDKTPKYYSRNSQFTERILRNSEDVNFHSFFGEVTSNQDRKSFPTGSELKTIGIDYPKEEFPTEIIRPLAQTTMRKESTMDSRPKVHTRRSTRGKFQSDILDDMPFERINQANVQGSFSSRKKVNINLPQINGGEGKIEKEDSFDQIEIYRPKVHTSVNRETNSDQIEVFLSPKGEIAGKYRPFTQIKGGMLKEYSKSTIHTLNNSPITKSFPNLYKITQNQIKSNEIDRKCTEESDTLSQCSLLDFQMQSNNNIDEDIVLNYNEFMRNVPIKPVSPASSHRILKVSKNTDTKKTDGMNKCIKMSRKCIKKKGISPYIGQVKLEKSRFVYCSHPLSITSTEANSPTSTTKSLNPILYNHDAGSTEFALKRVTGENVKPKAMSIPQNMVSSTIHRPSPSFLEAVEELAKEERGNMYIYPPNIVEKKMNNLIKKEKKGNLESLSPLGVSADTLNHINRISRLRFVQKQHLKATGEPSYGYAKSSQILDNVSYNSQQNKMTINWDKAIKVTRK